MDSGEESSSSQVFRRSPSKKKKSPAVKEQQPKKSSKKRQEPEPEPEQNKENATPKKKLKVSSSKAFLPETKQTRESADWSLVQSFPSVEDFENSNEFKDLKYVSFSIIYRSNNFHTWDVFNHIITKIQWRRLSGPIIPIMNMLLILISNVIFQEVAEGYDQEDQHLFRS